MPYNATQNLPEIFSQGTYFLSATWLSLLFAADRRKEIVQYIKFTKPSTPPQLYKATAAAHRVLEFSFDFESGITGKEF